MRKVSAVIVGLVILIGGGMALGWAGYKGGNTYYEGTEVFRTEADYIAFKEAFIDGEVKLIDVNILASEPPIIVSFKAKVPSYEYKFSYGERSIEGYLTKDIGGIAVLVLTSVSIIALSVLVPSLWWEE